MTVSRHRWLAKKSARSAVMLGSWAARRIAAPPPGRSLPSVRVLTYHRFGDATRDPWCVSARTFEAQVRWLAENRLAVSLQDVLAFARGETTLPNGAALITTDDGFSSVATIAAPILKRYQVPSVTFVTTSLVGVAGVQADDPYMTWDQVARLQESFVTLGSHAHNHRSLGKLPLDEAREEGARSRALMRERAGLDVHTFAYPYGMRPDENAQTRQALSEVGYTSVFIAQHGTIQPGSDVLRLPRVKVEGGEPAWMFPMLCAGAMDVWKVFDDTMWRMQRPER